MTTLLRFVPSFLLASALTACEVSPEEEASLGRELAAELDAELPLLDDPASWQYVQALGERIAAGAGAGDADWRFVIVDAAEVNAFALPGGYIYVNRGLIERAGSMAELAGVLAHEVAHVVERHAADRMEDAQAANVGVGIVCTLTDICSSGAAQIAIDVGGSAYFARNSREDEREADAVAVDYLIEAGIDPRGIPSMFATLLEARERDPSLLDSWFGSHPLEEERIERSRELVAQYDPVELNRLVKDDPAFRAFQQRLRRLPPPPPPAQPSTP